MSLLSEYTELREMFDALKASGKLKASLIPIIEAKIISIGNDVGYKEKGSDKIKFDDSMLNKDFVKEHGTENYFHQLNKKQNALYGVGINNAKQKQIAHDLMQEFYSDYTEALNNWYEARKGYYNKSKDKRTKAEAERIENLRLEWERMEFDGSRWRNDINEVAIWKTVPTISNERILKACEKKIDYLLLASTPLAQSVKNEISKALDELNIYIDKGILQGKAKTEAQKVINDGKADYEQISLIANGMAESGFWTVTAYNDTLAKTSKWSDRK